MGSMEVSVEMQHTGDPSVQAEVQLRGVPSVGHGFCPAKSTQLCSLGSSQSPLAVSFDALLGGFGPPPCRPYAVERLQLTG